MERTVVVSASVPLLICISYYHRVKNKTCQFINTTETEFPGQTGILAAAFYNSQAASGSHVANTVLGTTITPQGHAKGGGGGGWEGCCVLGGF